VSTHRVSNRSERLTADSELGRRIVKLPDRRRSNPARRYDS
jgi:hypothetical protein